jgi:hypothetical protein
MGRRSLRELVPPYGLIFSTGYGRGAYWRLKKKPK